MYQLSTYINDSIFTNIKKEGLKFDESLNIKSCAFSSNLNNIEESRIKLLSVARIPILDKRIDNAISLITELWFDGSEVTNVNYILMDRFLMDDDKGPFVSCMGSILFTGNEDTNIFRQGIGKLLPFLKKIKYIGPIALNTVIKGDVFYAVELTPTMGYDYTFITFELMSNKLENLIWQLANNVFDGISYKSNLGIAIDLCVMPFPLEVLNNFVSPIRIEGLNQQNLKHFWGYDIQRNADVFTTANKGGRIGTVVARGNESEEFSSIREARRRAYRTINNLKIEELMYRGDIGFNFDDRIRELKSYGWLN